MSLLMNMTRRYKPVHNKRRLIGQIAITIAVLLVIIFSPLFSWLLGPAHALSRPFWWLSQTFSSSAHNTVELTRSKKSLVGELNTLSEEAARLQSVDAENRVLRNENAELQELLGSTPASHQGTMARILVRPPQTWYDSLIVDQGTASGIAIGDIAYAYGTIPLGAVLAATDNTATIELYSASSRITDAVVVPGNIPVQASGTGNSSFHFKVHRDLAIDENSTLVLPTGELLATVKSVQFDTRDPFRSIRATSAANLQHLRFITIVKK